MHDFSNINEYRSSVTELREFSNQTKGQEDIKARIDGSLKSVTEQLSQITNNEKLQEVYLMVSAFPQLIEASLRNVQTYLHNTTKEMQARKYGNKY